MEMMLDKKQIQAIFLSSKWIVKQWRQLTTSTMHVAQELQTNGLCSDGSRSFAKETRALKKRTIVAGLQKLTTTNWESSSKLILLQLQKLPKNSMSSILWLLGIWSKLEQRSSLISGCFMSWPKIKKIVILKGRLLLFYATMNHFSIRLWCAMKTGFYMTTSSVSELRSSKALPKAKLATKRGLGHWWSAADLIHCSFLGASQVVLVVKNPPANEGDVKRHWFDPWVGTIPSEPQQKPLHLRSTLSKSMRCTENCNTCSPSWSTKRAQFFSTTMPDCMSHNKCFKRWMTEWLDHILPHPPYSPDAAKSLQSCPTLCDPIDRSPPGPAIPGILQARVLEWVAFAFSA